MSEYKDRYCGIITILKTLPFPQASTTKQGESTYQIVHCKGVYRLTIDWNNGIIKVEHQTHGTVDYWSKFSPLLELFKTKEEREVLPTYLNMLVDLLPERNYEVTTSEQLFNYIYAHDVDLHMNMVRAQFNAPILYAFIKWYSDEYGYPYELMKKMVERHLKYREKFDDIISFYQDEVRAVYYNTYRMRMGEEFTRNYAIVLNKALDALAELHEQYKLSGECVIHNNNEIDTKYPLKLRASTPTIEN